MFKHIILCGQIEARADSGSHICFIDLVMVKVQVDIIAISLSVLVSTIILISYILSCTFALI